MGSPSPFSVRSSRSIVRRRKPCEIGGTNGYTHKGFPIEADRQVPGRLDHATGRIELTDLIHPEVDDLLDDLGELVLKKGGDVMVVPGEHMPTQTGIAAIFRY